MKPYDPIDQPTAVPADEPAGRPIPSDPTALLFQAEAAHLLGLSPRTLEAMRVRGGGPVFYAIGRRSIRYQRSDVIAWREMRRRASTSDPGTASSNAGAIK